MSDEIKDAFAVAFADGPATSPSPVDKAAARQAGATTQQQFDGLADRVDDVEDDLSDLTATVTAINTGSAEGLIVETTLANLNARAAALGLGSGDAGRGGRVYQDGNAANNGDYRWSGSAWQIMGAGRLGAAEANILALTRRTMQLTCNREIIVDKRNILGGGPAVYVPDSLKLVVNGATLVSKTLTADPKMIHWAKIAITDTAELQTLYLDINDDANPVKVSAEMPVDATRYFHIVSLFGSMQGWAGTNKIISTEEWRATFISDEPVVFDANEGKIYIPQLRGLRGGGSLSWNLNPLSTNDRFREVSVAVTGSAVFVWADVYACVADSRAANCIVSSTGYTNRPFRDGSALVLLGVVFSRHFTPAHPDLRIANIVPNQFGAGREDNDLADIVFGVSAPASLTKSESLALGFTRGYAADTGTNVYYGGAFPQARNTGFLFYRFFIETDVAGEFYSPRCFQQRRASDGTTSLEFVGATLEKQHSANVREYSGYVSITGNDPIIGAYFGTSGMTQNGVRVFGVQFWLGTTMDAWVGKKDYPRSRDEIGNRIRSLEAGGASSDPLDPIVPPRFYVHPDRPYPIYLDQMFGKTGRGRYRAVVQSQKESYKPLYSREVPDGTLVLDAARLGTSLDFILQDVTVRNRKIMRSSPVRVLSPSAIDALSLRALFLGDSITDWNGTAVQAVRRLQDMGVTMTTIGTLSQSSVVSGDGTIQGEGRTSRRMADFYGLTLERMAFLPSGNEAAYLAMDETAKRGYNPFLKGANGDDLASRPEMIFNGNIFDMRYYLTRFSLADPDVVVINLATNDFNNETAEVAAQHVATGLNIIVKQTRRALPNAKIMLAYNSRGYPANDSVWEGGFRACLLEYLKFVVTTTDDKVFFVPGYCTVNRLASFNYSLTADPNTGLSAGSITDATHYIEAGVREFGEVLAQFIAGAATE